MNAEMEINARRMAALTLIYEGCNMLEGCPDIPQSVQIFKIQDEIEHGENMPQFFQLEHIVNLANGIGRLSAVIAEVNDILTLDKK